MGKWLLFNPGGVGPCIYVYDMYILYIIFIYIYVCLCTFSIPHKPQRHFSLEELPSTLTHSRLTFEIKAAGEVVDMIVLAHRTCGGVVGPLFHHVWPKRHVKNIAKPKERPHSQLLRL